MFLARIVSQNYKVITKVKYSAKTLSTFPNTNFQNYGRINDDYDIIIAGGGMVGCTLACALGNNSVLSKYKVLLLEGSPNKKFEFKPEYSNRVVALNQNTKTLMNSLKVWRHIEKMRLQPVRQMQVWDACSDALITFNSSDILNDDIAYIVENDVLLHAVNTELSEQNNVDIVYSAKIVDYELPSSGSAQPSSLVRMENGDIFSCQLLIGADGANSAVRKAMGVQYLSWNYDQMGVVATLNLSEEIDNTTAWQRFLPTGPVALLPLTSNSSSLVWSTTVKHAKQLLQMPDEQFVDALNDALWKQYPRSSGVEACLSWVEGLARRVGAPGAGVTSRAMPPSVRAIAPGSRAAFPLGFGHATRYAAPGVLLIGDAAHRVHPLAGQGVNLGFGDISDLNSFLGDAVFSGLEITHHSLLERYETARQRHNVPTQLAIDALHRLYTVDLPPVVLLRSLGLQLTNAIQPLKSKIMAHAMA